MAWNPTPEVAVARDAAQRLGADMAVIVYITLDTNATGMASYGRTKALCSVAGKLGDDLFAATAAFAERAGT